tara:strand:- start:684 stop:1514 length:831 start_codon:yes stop_codon:yes gene_type:complete
MDYNLPSEKIETYKLFQRRNVDQMPILLSEERSPVWAARFMRRRIDHSKELPDLKSYADTGDLLAYDDQRRSKNVKFLLTVDKNGMITEEGLTALQLINPDEYKKNSMSGALNLGERYDELPGIEVSIDDMITGRRLTEKEILNHKGWRILARHPDEVPEEFSEDKHLLEEYAKWVKAETGYGDVMGFYSDPFNDVQKLRALCLNWTECGSGVYGSNLDNGNGRFVGLAPEAQQNVEEIRARRLEQEVLKSLEGKTAFRHNGTTYVPVTDESFTLK